MAVDSTVVTMDSEYELICTAQKRLVGITCGVTPKANIVIPRAESVYQLICPQGLEYDTYRPNVEDQRDNYYHPTTVAYDPAPPDLQGEGY